MIPSIFSTFDFNLLPRNLPRLISLTPILIPPLILTQLYWTNLGGRSIILKTTSSLVLILNINNIRKHLIGSANLITSTLYILFTLNLRGAIPYLTSFTSHLLFTASVGGPLWASIILINLNIKTKTIKSHILPERAPQAIALFLSIVESLSYVIRPITLSFRLAANIRAGHVILGIIRAALRFSLIIVALLILIFIIISRGVAYASFEFTICIVQAFVFTLLAIIYSSDHLNPQTPTIQNYDIST